MSKQNILKLIIFIMLIGLIFIIYINFYIPYKIQKDLENNDIQSIDNLNKLFENVKMSEKNLSSLEINTVYLSLPSYFTDCKDIELPELKKPWKYSCKNKEIYRKVDGSGWLPLNTDKYEELPIGDIEKKGFFYSFAVGSSSEKVLSVQLKSNRYINNNAKKTCLKNIAILGQSEIYCDALGVVLNLDNIMNGNNVIQDNSIKKYKAVLFKELYKNNLLAENFLEIPNSGSEYFKEISIISTIKLNSLNSGKGRISEKGSNYKNRNFSFEVREDGSLAFTADTIKKGTDGVTLQSNRSTIKKGLIYNVIATKGKDSLSLYVNGDLVAKRSIDPEDDLTSNNDIITLGKSFDYKDGFFDGQILNLTILNRELSNLELVNFSLR